MGKYALPPLIMLFNEEIGSPSNSSCLSNIAKPHFLALKTHNDSWRKIGVSPTKTLKDRGQGSQIHGFLFSTNICMFLWLTRKTHCFSTQIHLGYVSGCQCWKTLVLFRQNSTTFLKFCGKDLKHKSQATTRRSRGWTTWKSPICKGTKLWTKPSLSWICLRCLEKTNISIPQMVVKNGESHGRIH